MIITTILKTEFNSFSGDHSSQKQFLPAYEQSILSELNGIL